MTKDKQPLVSFIIPHKGRDDMLIATLDSIFSQNEAPADIEVLVISQNSTLLNVEQKFNQDNFNIHYSPKHLTISALRNIGAKHAQGDYFAFLDADIQLANDWLKVMLSCLNKNPKRVLVSAMQKNGSSPTQLEQVRTLLSNVSLDCEVGFLPGRNLLLSRDSFAKVAGFPEHLITCEDYYFTEQLSHYGQLFYSSATNYVHLGEDKDFSAMFTKEVWRGQSNLNSIQGRRPPLREIPSFIVPLIVLFSLIFTVNYALSLQFIPLILTTLIWLVPLILYSVRLMLIKPDTILAISIFKFYCLYFPARALGTLKGISLMLFNLRKANE